MARFIHTITFSGKAKRFVWTTPRKGSESQQRSKLVASCDPVGRLSRGEPAFRSRHTFHLFCLMFASTNIMTTGPSHRPFTTNLPISP